MEQIDKPHEPPTISTDITASSDPAPTCVEIAAPRLADNDAVIHRLVEVINKAYGTSEAEFWKPGHVRTSDAEIAAIVRRGEMAIAWSGLTPSESAADILGCIHVLRVSPRAGELGMLACDEAALGNGIGRSLVHFAEEYMKAQGAEVMQLDILTPKTWTHGHKARLESWYRRRGYNFVSYLEFNDRFGRAAAFLACPAVFRQFEKPL